MCSPNSAREGGQRQAARLSNVSCNEVHVACRLNGDASKGEEEAEHRQSDYATAPVRGALVCCEEGVNRSPTLVLAALLLGQGWARWKVFKIFEVAAPGGSNTCNERKSVDQWISGSVVEGALTEEPRPDASNARRQRPATRAIGVSRALACVLKHPWLPSGV
jgi:hypothetical protein